MAAFRDAAKHTHYLETDLWLSSDGQIVLHHDPSLLRTYGVDKNITALSYKEILNISGGSVPLLYDVFNELSGCFFNIEIKQDNEELVKKATELIQFFEHEEKTLLTSNIDSCIKKIRKHSKGIHTGMSIQEGIEFFTWFKSGCKGRYTPPGRALQIPLTFDVPNSSGSSAQIDLVNESFISVAHSVGLEVHYWTVNTTETAQRLFDLHADGIFTDLPHLFSK